MFVCLQISVSIAVVYFTDRAKSKTVLPFTHIEKSMVISVVTQTVAVWYGVPLYVLQLRVWQFGIADRFMYCSLQCGSLV